MCFNPFLRRNPRFDKYFDSSDYIMLENERYTSDTFPVNSVVKTLKSLKEDLNELSESPVKESKNIISRYEILHRYLDSVYLSYNGVRIPMYFECPCGRCIDCVSKKYKELCSLLTLEASQSTFSYFLTLTYDDLHLPSEGLVKKHVQMFMKRFRRNIEYYSRKYFPKNDTLPDLRFRAFYCGEYGHKTTRPHYHAILFFHHKDKWSPYITVFLRRMLRKSWDYGYILDLQYCRSQIKSARYIAKYVLKSLKERSPYGKTPMFVQGTSRDGGLGLYNYTSYITNVLESRDGKMVVHCDGKPVVLRIPRKLFDKIFPKAKLSGPLGLSDYISLIRLVRIKCYRYMPFFMQSVDVDDVLRKFTAFPKTRPSYLYSSVTQSKRLVHFGARVFKTYEDYENFIKWINEANCYELEKFLTILVDDLRQLIPIISDSAVFENYCLRKIQYSKIYGKKLEKTICESIESHYSMLNNVIIKSDTCRLD